MKPRSTHVIGAVVIASACAAAMVQAQGRGGEWTTSRGDAQRTSWVRTDVRLTKDAVQKGELKFLWKMKLDNDTRQLNALTTPVLMDRLISHRGFKALAFLGGSSERMYAVDTDLARVYWTTVINYSSITPPANSSWACPGGLIAAATRPTSFAVSAFGGAGGGGRGGRSGSSVGEPGKGAPSLALVAQAQGGRGSAPNDPVPAGRGAAPGAPRSGSGRPRRRWRRLGGGPTDNVYVLASDGFARTINPHNGSDRTPPVPFLPANANASGLIFVDGVLYTSTSNNCGASAEWRVGNRSRRRQQEASVVEDQRRQRSRDRWSDTRNGRHDLRRRWRRRSGQRRLFQFDRCARAEDAEAEGRVHAGWRRLQHVAGDLPSQGQGRDGGQRQRRAALPPRCVVAEDAALRHAEIQQCRRDWRTGDVGERRHAVDPGASGRRCPAD